MLIAQENCYRISTCRSKFGDISWVTWRDKLSLFLLRGFNMTASLSHFIFILLKLHWACHQLNIWRTKLGVNKDKPWFTSIIDLIWVNSVTSGPAAAPILNSLRSQNTLEIMRSTADKTNLKIGGCPCDFSVWDWGIGHDNSSVLCWG